MPKLSSIDLLDRIVIYLDGEIDDECAREIIKKLLKLDIQSHKDITMYINSAGGSVASGTKTDRLEFNRLLQSVSRGDTIVSTKVVIRLW